jgi:hypothetical protein
LKLYAAGSEPLRKRAILHRFIEHALNRHRPSRNRCGLALQKL